jgi:hypothetical protein
MRKRCHSSDGANSSDFGPLDAKFPHIGPRVNDDDCLGSKVEYSGFWCEGSRESEPLWMEQCCEGCNTIDGDCGRLIYCESGGNKG